MKSNDYLNEPILLDETYDGFKVYFVAFPEHTDPAELFDHDEKEIKKLYRDLDNYDLVWFCAHVFVKKAGIELGTDYLGGCLYKDYDDFVKIEKDGYLADMMETALKEARPAAKELAVSLLE